MSIEYTDLEKKISKTLIDIGVNPGLLGYFYLKSAVKYAIFDDEYIRSITKKMYPAIAKDYGSTSSRVERAIRNAIETLFLRCDTNVIKKYFGNTPSTLSGKVTNTAFISTVVEYIRSNYSNIEEEKDNG